MSSKRVFSSLLNVCVAAGAVWAAAPALAAEPDSCKTVRMSDPGWTDITSTNAMSGVILNALGYTQQVTYLSVPITYVGLSKNQADVFLGNWMPAQKATVEPLIKDGKIEVLRANLPRARMTLAVPKYVADAGVKSVDDLAKYAKEFDSSIYGIEPGSSINQTMKKMLDAKAHGLGGWKLVESSESSMLAQVSKRTGASPQKWVVFIAWEPHLMNTKYDLVYLSGGEEYFGPNFGAATVNTVSRKDYSTQCPNVAKLFKQIEFTVDLETKMIAELINDKVDAKAVAAKVLKQNPKLVEAWVSGVKTFSGEDGLPAVKKALGM